MPTYEYECTTCGYIFEEFQSMSDDPLSKCPECGKKVRRLIGGGVGVIFKGSGFYVTDNKKSSASGKTVSTEEKKSSDSANTPVENKTDKSDKKESKKKEKKSA